MNNIKYEEINIFNRLNEPQKDAVFHNEGPMLVLAGAGTGKTGVLTTRLIRILMEKRALPGEILSVTFTNKAANEMKERITNQIGNLSTGLKWLGTFHSIGAQILRFHPEKVDLEGNFIILDTDDQIRLLKQIIKDENIDDKRWPAKQLLNLIDKWKNKGLYPEDISANDGDYYANGKGQKLYKIYQQRLKFFNASDFGDLILECIRLFENNPDILNTYQRRFKFILVDEYQDTNFSQHKLLKLISGEEKNICCVGDDDQSIYSWRGAEVSNILKFEKDFTNAKVIRLEENYRSTGHILSAASKLIENNESRLGKTLWTGSGEGEKVIIKSVWDGEEEARQITSELEKMSLKNINLDETAILVRASYQMREFEDRFISVGLPYKVIGGPRFYERKEIRDVNAYLRLAVRPEDSLALERVINTPKRGIGETSVKKIRDHSKIKNLPMIESIKDLLSENIFKGKAQNSLEKLVNLINHWNQLIIEEDKVDIAEIIVEDSGYLEMLKNEKSVTSEGRIENIYELFRSLEPFENIRSYLEHISLVMEIDSNNAGKKVSLMTLHAAKGLEFDYIFLPGWEEGVFPNQRAIDEGGIESLEEERRLAYVGITRAKKKSSIFYAANRRIHNQWISSMPSRFVSELPEDNTETDLSNYSGEKELFREQEFTDFDQSDYETPGWERAKYNSEVKVIDHQETANKNLYNDSPFKLGSKVIHKKFGKGKILSIDGKKLTINFGESGTRKVMENFVVPSFKIKNINRIKKLRKLISDNQLDAFLIPHEDEFLSEYLPKYTERLKWITGFTGSAGLSIISTNKAAIFVDGRYTTQVKLETSNKAFDYFHLIDPGLFKWIEKNPYKLKRLGFDPRTISQSNYKALNYSCAKKGIKLIESKNLIDELWKRKKERNNKVAIHELKYSGLSSSKKRNKIVSYLKKHKVNSLFISQPENLCWLLNIRGNDLEHTPIVRSSAVITKDNSITIFTDNKNIKGKIHQWIGKEIEILNFNNIKNFISKTNFKSIQFDPNYTPSNIAKIFNNFILETFERDDPITLLKACKNSTEINGSRKAHLIDGIALTKFLCWLDTSSSETRIDELTTCEELLKYRKRSKSFKSLSFNTISGTGSNGAIIHYKSNKKSNKFLKENDLFLLDSGGQYKYGTTDVTRTISIAKDQKKIDYEKIINFTLVLKGHIALALEHFKYGETGLKLDYLARKFLKKNGLNFDHGTGHGVGSYLGVHEGPQNISPRSRIILEKGMIISNEPGYYKENEYGIRIENLVTVVKSKNKNKDLTMETLTLAPIDKKLIDKSLLTKKEISWLNNYHNKVYRKLNPYLNKKEKLWLKNSTKAI